MSNTLIEVSEDELHALRLAAQRAENAAEGDSNDVEIEALWDFVTIATEALGVEW